MNRISFKLWSLKLHWYLFKINVSAEKLRSTLTSVGDAAKIICANFLSSGYSLPCEFQNVSGWFVLGSRFTIKLLKFEHYLVSCQYFRTWRTFKWIHQHIQFVGIFFIIFKWNVVECLVFVCYLNIIDQLKIDNIRQIISYSFSKKELIKLTFDIFECFHFISWNNLYVDYEFASKLFLLLILLLCFAFFCFRISTMRLCAHTVWTAMHSNHSEWTWTAKVLLVCAKRTQEFECVRCQ